MLVHSNGGRYWRLAYRFDGKQKTLALGVYPDVSLADARDRREQARKLLANGADPGAVKQEQKAAVVALAENSFEVIAREWFSKHSPNWKENHSSKILARLKAKGVMLKAGLLTSLKIMITGLLFPLAAAPECLLRG